MPTRTERPSWTGGFSSSRAMRMGTIALLRMKAWSVVGTRVGAICLSVMRPMLSTRPVSLRSGDESKEMSTGLPGWILWRSRSSAQASTQALPIHTERMGSPTLAEPPMLTMRSTTRPSSGAVTMADSMSASTMSTLAWATAICTSMTPRRFSRICKPSSSLLARSWLVSATSREVLAEFT